MPFNKIFTPENQVKLRHFTQCFADVLALIGVIRSDIDQFRRRWSMIKTIIYEKLVFSHSIRPVCGWFVANDFNERINHIISIITALIKTNTSTGKKNENYSHHSYHNRLLIQNKSNINGGALVREKEWLTTETGLIGTKLFKWKIYWSQYRELC